MCKTYTCQYDCGLIQLSIRERGHSTEVESLPPSAVHALVNRRTQKKLARSTVIAGILYEHFGIPERIAELGGDPRNTPMLICNRYANWDYVADSMCPDVTDTIDSVNSYVATAWFPAAVQGFLTIEYGNKGEAITVASPDAVMIYSTIRSLLKAKTRFGGNERVAIFGTFEHVPEKIGGCRVASGGVPAFGAISLIHDGQGLDDIRAVINDHIAMYMDKAA